ncbi:hypothetical protein O7632_09130 [Solwaraspora sp. WMMD406]|uniref:hypothetical protein n=1 Tax=Solwaraspora sp. WMMD406 TaxID=3016095 RepID=UPI002416E31C|nr:hypothetical protein [Solwaraspora sp. WMMD406]MDG4764266.1 hypothetical protein [Solwaraspora sp. WMMD406]
MDFWDLTKLLFRRWYIATPLLLISVAAAGWTGTSVQPDYIATSYVQLIPPTAANTPPDEDTPASPRNPWLELGLGSLSRAAALTVQDQAVLKQLEADGFSENVAITLDNQQPIMTIEVIGESAEQATETSEEVVRRLEASVVGLQADYGANEESFITARRLDRGDNIQEANSKVKRAMVAVGGVGVLLSAALTIGFDGLMRRRRRGPATGVPVSTGPGSDDTMKLPSGTAVATPEISIRYAPSTRRPTSTDGGHSGGVYSSGSRSERPDDVPSGAQANRGGIPFPRVAGRPAPGSGAGSSSVGATSGAGANPGGDARGGPGGPPRGAAGGDTAGSGLPSAGRGTGPQPAGDKAGQPADSGGSRVPRSPDADETAVISAVPAEDATIILPIPPVGRDSWTSEVSENGSRTR